jgi:hypothetical protein
VVTVTTVTIRGREVLEQQLADALAALADIDKKALSITAGFTRGVADAMEWVLGYSGTAPITLASNPWPSPAAVVDEHRAAADVLYRRTDDGGRDRAWVSGVEHALLWACGGTSNAPISEPLEI